MNVGDVVWWTGEAPLKPRKVRLKEECGDGFIYQTIGGATGWQARAPRSDFAPIGRRKR